MGFRYSPFFAFGFVLLVACGDSTDPPDPTASCTNSTPLQLGVGEHAVIDPAQNNGCFRVPAAGANGAEYIVVLASTNGTRSQTGVSGPFLLRASNPSATTSPELAQTIVEPDSDPVPATADGRFHGELRKREHALTADPRNRGAAPAPPASAVPPVEGDVRTFKVCADDECDTFTDVVATARYVGSNSAIYMDNTVPQNDPLQTSDFEELSDAFDDHHYPIDVASFGNVSDIDNNQRVIILMTDAVNALTPDCEDGRVLGYFYGLDLLTSGPGTNNSNRGEIFYTFVPEPAHGNCSAISRQQAVNRLKPTLIHELQHMISWNEHVIVRAGNAEETWLNEGLSHYAEELAGRLIPDAECVADGFQNCRGQYSSGNIINSYDYLENTEAQFLVFPIPSGGTLEERGASWLFVRWVVDQFAADTVIGAAFTRSLVQTTSLGANNITARTGETFARIVPEWLLAAYLDDLPGFTGASARLRLRTWGLRAVWLNPANASLFNMRYPLRPDSTGGTYSRSGTLRAGSGRHLRLIQPANGPAIEVQATRNATGLAIDPALAARFGVARVR